MNCWPGGTSSPRAGLAVRAERDQRIVGVQRHEHRAAALDGLIDAMVEELAEEREQRVVRRREADVRRHVRDEQRLVRWHAAGGHAGDGRRRGSGSWCTDARPGCSACARGTAAAAMAAGLVDVWSTIRFEITRGCVVEHEALLLRVRRARDRAAARTEEIGRATLGCAEERGRQARERLVRSRELVTARRTGCCTIRRPCAGRSS